MRFVTHAPVYRTTSRTPRLHISSLASPVRSNGRAEHWHSATRRRAIPCDPIYYHHLITQLELYLDEHPKIDDAFSFHLLRSVPGIGKILALLLYEIHTIDRFAFAGDFLFYTRLNQRARRVGRQAILIWLPASLVEFVVALIVKK